MIFRRWTINDNPQIFEIERDSFSDPWSIEMLDDCFLATNFYGLVAELNERIVAYVGAVFAYDSADIVNVCVEKSFRKQSIGTVILFTLIEHLKNKGVEHVYLEVRRSNSPAIGLYEKLGFKKAGERKAYYEDGEDALVYRYDYQIII